MYNKSKSTLPVHVHILATVYTVPLKYNLISKCMKMHGKMRYFVHKMPKFAVEIKIAMR